MKKNDVNETLLAEIIEQNGKLQKDLLGMKKAIDGLSEDLTKFANQFSPMPKSNEFEEMVPKKDADERARFLIRTYVDLQDKYAQLKEDYGELQAKTRHWASNQWAKHLFRWLFIKRHLWIWVVYIMLVVSISLSVYYIAEQRREIQKLKLVEMKYRYLHATGTALDVLSNLDDAFDDGDVKKVQQIRSIVKDYEHAVKHKSDSIVRAEKKKIKEWE